MTDKEIIEKQAKEIEELTAKIHILQEQLQELLRHRFGQRREKFIDENQPLLDLFDGEVVEANTQEPEVEEVTVVKKKKRKQQNYGQFLASLEEVEEIIDLPEEEKEGLVCIGEDVKKLLSCIPAQYFVKVIRIKKYAKQDNANYGIITPEVPKAAIQGSLSDESYLARIAILKYAYHLTLYRIVEMMRYENIIMSRQTLSKMMMNIAKAVNKIYDLMRQKILECGTLHIDETTVKEQAKGKCKTSYFWTLACSNYDGKLGAAPIVYYQYIGNRNHENVVTILGEDFQGKIHSDAYQAYEKFAQKDGVIWQLCWAHARRKFYDSKSPNPIRNEILKLMDELFEIEREYWEIAKDLSLEESERLAKMKQIRSEKSGPKAEYILQKIKDFRYTGKIHPKEKLTEACDYMLNRKENFLSFIENLDMRIDNNICERSIRPLTIGRKNWLFVGSENGGEAAAIISTLIQTCRNLGINPEKYLESTLRKINNIDDSELENLLPWNFSE